MDFKELRDKIRKLINIDSTKSILESFGIDISASGHFKLRDERTPSAYINKDGSVYDFGSKEHKDIVSILYDGYALFNTVGEATKYVANYFGIEIDEEITPNKLDSSIYKLDDNLKSSGYYSIPNSTKEKTTEQIKSYMEFLDSRLNPNDEFYRDELNSIAPTYLFDEADEESLKEFKRLTTFDYKHSTLVVKIFDYNGVQISYKRRRFRQGKWITAGGTHPNKQCYIRDIDRNEKIYIVEGHHDLLSAILLNINFIMIPTSNYKEFNEIEIEHLKDREVVFLPDIEEKTNVGLEAMQNLANSISDIAKSTKLVNLKELVEFHKNLEIRNKMDLSDSLEFFESKKEFFETLSKFEIELQKREKNRLLEIEKRNKKERIKKFRNRNFEKVIELNKFTKRREKIILESIEHNNFRDFFQYLIDLDNLIVEGKTLKKVAKLIDGIGLTELRKYFDNYKKEIEELKEEREKERALEPKYKLPNGFVYPNGYSASMSNIQKIDETKGAKYNLFPICYVKEYVGTVTKESSRITVVFPLTNQSLEIDTEIFVEPKKLEALLIHNQIYIENVKEFKKYVNLFLGSNRDKIQTKNLYTSTGWHKVDGELKYLNPIVADEKIEFIDEIEDVIYKSGSKDEQLRFIERGLKNRGSAIAILSALASPLVAITGADNFAVNFYGTNGAGKTLASSIGLSLFGSTEKGGLYRTFDSTNFGDEAFFDQFQGTPILIDEMMTAGNTAQKRAEKVMTMIYRFHSGKGRTRGNINLSVRKSKKFSGMMFTTMEENLRTLEAQLSGGIAKGTHRRAIQVNADNKKLFNSSMDIDYFVENIKENFGHFSEDYIEYISKNIDKVKENFYINRDILKNQKLNINGMESTFSLLVIAMNILRDIFKFDIEKVRRYLWDVIEENEEISEDINSLEQNIEDFESEISFNISKFLRAGADGELIETKGESWGEINSKNEILINSRAFNNIAININLTAEQLKKRLADFDILVTERDGKKTRYTKKKLLNSGLTVRMYVIRKDRLEGFENSRKDEDKDIENIFDVESKVILNGENYGYKAGAVEEKLNRKLEFLTKNNNINMLEMYAREIDAYNDKPNGKFIIEIADRAIEKIDGREVEYFEKVKVREV